MTLYPKFFKAFILKEQFELSDNLPIYNIFTLKNPYLFHLVFYFW